MRKLLLVTVVAVLLGVLAGQALADGPAIWVEKCPVRHYELRIEQPTKDVLIVSCIRMAEEAPDND
jgi:hypothetical protein